MKIIDLSIALGISSSSQTQFDPFAGIIQLASGQTNGNYVTSDIMPSGFDAWMTLTLDGTFSSPMDISVEILDFAGMPIPGHTGLSLSPLSTVDLSGIDATAFLCIRARINLLDTGGPRPVVDSLNVTWNPVSRVLIDKSAPVTAVSGDRYVYRVRYSLNFVEAMGLVVWDTLPSQANGDVIYPMNYGQNDEPRFVSATGGVNIGPVPAI